MLGFQVKPKKYVHFRRFKLYVIEYCLGCHGQKENEQMGVGEDWVCFDVEKEYIGEEDEVLWPYRPEERYGEKTDARKDGRQAEKGQTSNDLVPGF